jgi:hypothetical protein
MMTRMRFAVLIILILCLRTSFAECPPDCESQTGNSDATQYGDPGYYASTDPAGWDYSRVEWDKVPAAKIPDIPADKLQYDRLDPEQRHAMNTEQIGANFDKIGDLTKDVEKSRAEEAIAAKYSVYTDLGSGASIKNDVLTANYGKRGQVTLTDSLYKEGLLTVAANGRIEFLPSERKKEISFPLFDTATLITARDDITLLTPTGNMVPASGMVSFSAGSTYIAAGDTGMVNGVQISSSSAGRTGSQDTIIFFDGKKHPESNQDYASLGSNGKAILHANDLGGLDINFLEKNPYLKIDDKDSVLMSLTRNIDAVIENREDKELIPSVQLLLTKADGSAAVMSGATNFYIEDNKVRAVLLTDQKSTSSPMAVDIMGPSNMNLIGSNREPKKIIISNYNEIISIDIRQDTGIFENNNYAPGRVSESLYFNYDMFAVEDFARSYPYDTLYGRTDPTMIKRIMDTLDTMPAELKKPIEGFAIYTNEDFTKIAGENVGAYTTDLDRIIRLKEGAIFENVMFHEAAHNLVTTKMIYAEQIDSEFHETLIRAESLTGTRSSDIEGIRIELDKELPEEVKTELTTLVGKLETLQQKSDKTPSFMKQWTSIGGEVYNKGLIFKYQDEMTVTWADGETGPRYGCLSPYACKNYHEDIASIVENSYIDPEYMRSLIENNPDGQIYKSKIDFLWKEGFFTDKQYDTITRKVRVWAPKPIKNTL